MNPDIVSLLPILKPILTRSVQYADNNNEVDNDGYDVLDQHHKRNKPSKAPLFFADSDNENASSDNSKTEDDDEDEASSEGHAKTKRHSKTPYGSSAPNPTQLHFYPAQWTEVLELAKMKWRLQLVIRWAFPKRQHPETTEALKECLTTAIADHEADHGLVEKGEVFILSIIICYLSECFYEQDITRSTWIA